jgi:hypothetical protein
MAKGQAEAKAKASTRAKWRSSECTEQYAQKVLDTAGIVIALGKAWKRRNRDETVKLLEGIQRV